IILSTHILPEVENTCEKVIIINKGQLVATDTVDNLTSRLRGAESVAVEVAAEGLGHETAQRRLEQVPGVSRVILKSSQNGRCLFEVESLQGQSVRADVARAVVAAGWNLNELRPVGFSLEDIFLELTGAEGKDAAQGAAQ
ncbi:MAG: ABC transporter ATP-binding protein, partial [Bryobacteraceae bacterium]